MTDILDVFRGLQRWYFSVFKPALPVQPHHYVLNLDLGTARDKHEIARPGDFIYVRKLDGTAYLRINSKTEGDRIDLLYNMRISTPFKKFYITNSVQAGKTLELWVGGEAMFAVDPPKANFNIMCFDFLENLDATHNLVKKIYVPTKMKVVHGVLTSFSIRDYRSYIKALSHTHDVVIGAKTSDYETPSHTHSVTETTSSASDTASFGGIIDSYVGMWAHEADERTTSGPSAYTNVNHIVMKACPSGHAVCQVESVTPIGFGTHDHTHEVSALVPILGPTVIIWDDWSAKSHRHTVSGQTAEAGGGNHAHSVDYGTKTSGSGGATLGIEETVKTPDIGIIIDGVDRTAVLGGPWNTDQQELDISKYVVGWGFHTIEFTSTDLARLAGLIVMEIYI